jgi:hypothetical protein
LAPFHAFARDSGGLSARWSVPQWLPDGDVIIDSGFMGLSMETLKRSPNGDFEGTLRYIESIAACTLACGKRLWGNGKMRRENGRPTKFESRLDNPTARRTVQARERWPSR